MRLWFVFCSPSPPPPPPPHNNKWNPACAFHLLCNLIRSYCVRRGNPAFPRALYNLVAFCMLRNISELCGPPRAIDDKDAKVRISFLISLSTLILSAIRNDKWKQNASAERKECSCAETGTEYHYRVRLQPFSSAAVGLSAAECEGWKLQLHNRGKELDPALNAMALCIRPKPSLLT